MLCCRPGDGLPAGRRESMGARQMRHSVRFTGINVRAGAIARALLLVATLSALTGRASAQAVEAGGRWLVQTSVHTIHFTPDDRHNNFQKLVDIEYWRPDNWLAGGAWFLNSFGQPSQYLYVGRLWRPSEAWPGAYVKLTGGVLHGYKDEFRDKIPFNKSGYAPAILPSIGFSGRRFAGELLLFGNSGLMVTVGVFLD